MGNLWNGIGVMIVLLCLMVLMIAWLRDSKHKLQDANDNESFGVLNSIAMVTVLFLQRDYQINKNGLSIRFDILQ